MVIITFLNNAHILRLFISIRWFYFKLFALDHGTINFSNLERVLFGPQAHDRFQRPLRRHPSQTQLQFE